MSSSSTSRLETLREKTTSGFLGFWVRQFRMSYLIVITIVVMGSLAAIAIPKESSPSVKLGIISISTSYVGTNPVDMDSLVTDKIYKQVKDIKGIDKIQSSSSLGFSSISLTLKTDAVTKDVLSDVRSAVARATLPADAKTPVVTEIETDTSRVFSIFLYSKTGDTSKALLFEKATLLQKAVEKASGIKRVDLSANGNSTRSISTNAGSDATYEVHIILPEEKLANLGLSLSSIAGVIQSYNRDQPVGNFAIGDKKYDFRIEGKNRESFDFLKMPIALPKGGNITLGEIASIERKYKNDAQNILIAGGETGSVISGVCPTQTVKVSLSGSIGIGNSSSSCSTVGVPYVGLTVNKNDAASIFSASNNAKAVVEEFFKKPEYRDFGFMYGVDLADTISDDYKELLREAIITLMLVFVSMYLFVGFRDSVFASITLPLAFLSTFLILYYKGYTMNFLTNFSLIISFGIAVDTIIVIVQAASAKIRVGYDPEAAIMLALREYALPIISGVMTTIVVFIPMMTLPGILGKFLAYIPITIFGVLATGLVLALTVNSALYLLFVRKREDYIDSNHALEYASDEDKELLLLEREGKEKINAGRSPLRLRIIHAVTEEYKKILRNFLEHTFLRRTAIAVPVILLILSFVFLAGRIGLDIFPATDNSYASINITGPVGQKTEVTAKDLIGLSEMFVGYPEIKFTNINIRDNIATAAINLTKIGDRKAKGQRDVFEIQDILYNKVLVFEQKGYKVTSEVLKGGPPGTKAIGLKLIVDNPDKLSTLIDVSKDFEAAIKKISGAKNITRSSNDTPGQFVFNLKKDLIATTGITPAIIYSQISQSMNGVTIGTVEDDGEDMNVVLKSSQFGDDVRVEDVLSIPLTVGTTTYHIGDFVESRLTNATASITRENGDIQITVDADLEVGFDTLVAQKALTDFASSYEFPSGVSYKAGGENEANSELIIAILSAFFIALIVIFAILTLQFHSFSQPLVILYSVIMSLPLVMVGMLIMGNKFSLPFGIGFIAFTGIAVNHGIILIAAINENLKKGIEGITALVEAGSSRLEPMLLTTVTTALGILPIALRDKFWSGMGFTIIFGVISATTLTLFVVKGIYYEAYLRPRKPKKERKRAHTPERNEVLADDSE